MNSPRELKIGEKVINDWNPVYIIAEAGVNHDGSVEKARELIRVAKDAGADAVKFQAFRAEKLIKKNVEKAAYQQNNTDTEQSQFEMLRQLELGEADFRTLRDCCHESGIDFLITPFDEDSLSTVIALGIPALKISSTDLTNIPFLRRAAKAGVPIILSTGMSYMAEVELAVREIEQHQRQLVIMHCTANYPTSPNQVNLRVIENMMQSWSYVIGYSDHVEGMGASSYAVAMGCRVIEKHFTLNKTAPGPDHRASLNPAELRNFVDEIRRVETMLGDGIKRPMLCEINTRASLQKCLVAARNIAANEIIDADMLVGKRTGGRGISPLYVDSIVGTRAKKDYRENEEISR